MNTQPTRISILVLDESTMLTVASVIDPLRAANRLSGQRLFQWQLYATHQNNISLSGGVQLNTDNHFSHADGGEVLIVVASFNQQANATAATVQSLNRIAARYRIICGVEAGTWLLARAGLANGHRVTTHYEDFESIANRYPAIVLCADRFVIDRKIWTCGGASPALDMMLELIRQFHGKSIALQVASVFIYDETHAATDPQPVQSIGKLAHSEPRLAQAIQLMETRIEEPLPVSAIASALSVSVRTIEKLFKQHLNQTPANYYLKLRLTVARKMVLDTPLRLQEISVRTGFNSQSNFSRAFKRQYRHSPASLRNT
jgi:transcriptional regulator GlxA family with amidase domain